MHIKILGSGCANCARLEQVTREAAGELGLDFTVEKVTDFGEIAAYNIMKTPGLVVDEQVIVSGRVPTAAGVKELLLARAG